MALLLAVWNELRSRGLVPDEELILRDPMRAIALHGLSRRLLAFIEEPERS